MLATGVFRRSLVFFLGGVSPLREIVRYHDNPCGGYYDPQPVHLRVLEIESFRVEIHHNPDWNLDSNGTNEE